MTTIDLRTEPYDGASARRLKGAWDDEIRVVEPDFDPTSGLAVHADDFSSPRGIFLVAYANGEPVGCGGIRNLDESIGELKRLYVAAGHRGRGIGRLLLSGLVRFATEAGHARLRLDTDGGDERAVQLFRRAGFREIPDYNGNPLARLWFELELGGPR